MRQPGRDVARHDVGERLAFAMVVVVAAVVGTLLVSLGPGGSASFHARVSNVPATTRRIVAATGRSTRAATRRRSSATTTTVDPGALPQTEEKPTATGAQFDAGVNALWQAIVQDQPSVAFPFFFPEAAYVQVKDIADPAGDYQSRLLGNYDQDIHTLHAQLGDGASQAQLTGMSVPDDQAQWITPGTEDNKGSYWRVYGSTLNYTLEGQAHSFPVTSLISWRGQWYVVHLGQIR